MRLENNVLVLEREDCHWCKGQEIPGTMPAPLWKTCPKCKGTGRRGNGRCRNCNDRDGYYPHGRNPGNVIYYDPGVRMPCPNCEGSFHDFGMEDWTDNVPSEAFENMPIEVIQKSDRQMTWLEQHIGVGLWSSVDYGAHRSLTKDELAQKIREQLTGGKGANAVQACKVVKSKDDLTLCDGLAIVTSDVGYSIVPIFNER